MKFGYVLIAVVVALVAGFAVGALTGGDDENGDNDSSAVTRSDRATGASGAGEDTDHAAQTPSEDGDETTRETDGGEGTERAPESADDPRPEAPDDVIGDRPGAGGDEDSGQ